MSAQQRFNLRGADFVAAAADGFFQAPHNDDVAVAVKTGEVTGMEPAVTPLIAPLLAEKSGHAAGSAANQFAHLTTRQITTLPVNDPEFRAAARFSYRVVPHRRRIGRGRRRPAAEIRSTISRDHDAL